MTAAVASESHGMLARGALTILPPGAIVPVEMSPTLLLDMKPPLLLVDEEHEVLGELICWGCGFEFDDDTPACLIEISQGSLSVPG